MTSEPSPDASDQLASWASWVPFTSAVQLAPRQPGVYMVREGPAGAVVYVGMAGERRGQGIRGRLTVYKRGRAAVSGLGEAAMDRALGDAAWLRARLLEVEAGKPSRTRDWATAAMARANLYVRWATTETGDDARILERKILDALANTELWNRAR